MRAYIYIYSGEQCAMWCILRFFLLSLVLSVAWLRGIGSGVCKVYAEKEWKQTKSGGRRGLWFDKCRARLIGARKSNFIGVASAKTKMTVVHTAIIMPARYFETIKKKKDDDFEVFRHRRFFFRGRGNDFFCFHRYIV